MYIGLCSLLENSDEDLAGKRIGLFSYGSGCVAEFFTGVVQPGYKDALHGARHQALLSQRTELSYDDYITLYHYPNPTDGGSYPLAEQTKGAFRLAAISEHKREYVAR